MKNRNRLLEGLGQPFWVLWTGQSISIFGTQLVQFGLGVWILQRSGSALDYAAAIVASTTPAVLVAPFASNVVERVSRR